MATFSRENPIAEPNDPAQNHFNRLLEAVLKVDLTNVPSINPVEFDFIEYYLKKPNFTHKLNKYGITLALLKRNHYV